MRFLFPLSNSINVGGGSYVAINYAKGLALLGHEIEIYPTFDIKYFEKDTLPSNLKILGGFQRKKLFQNYIVSELMKKIFLDRIIFKRIIKMNKNKLNEIDYIISIPLTEGYRSIKLGKKIRKPVISIAFETEPLYTERMKKLGKKSSILKKFCNDFLKWRPYKKSLEKSDFLIAISPLTKKFVEKWVDKKVDAIIHPSVDEQIIKSYPVNLESVDKYIVYIGRLFPNKNVDHIIKALSLINNPPELKILGQGPLYDELKILAENLHVDCDFLGFVSDDVKWKTIAGSKCIVTPSSFEGSFDIPAEGGLFNIPNILYDIPGVREEWGEAVILVEENNIEQLAENIKEIVTNDALKEEIGKRANRKTLDYYTIKKCGKQLENLVKHSI